MAQRSTTTAQDSKISEAVVQFIAEHLTPDQVFEMDELRENVKDKSDPEDVFDTGELEKWALENGFARA